MKNNLKFIFACLLLGTGVTYAQVGVGTTTPNASSELDITSTTKGFLMPRMTTAQRTAIATPATGLQVYDTDTNSPWYYNGTAWVNAATAGTEWIHNGTDAIEATRALANNNTISVTDSGKSYINIGEYDWSSQLSASGASVQFSSNPKDASPLTNLIKSSALPTTSPNFTTSSFGRYVFMNNQFIINEPHVAAATGATKNYYGINDYVEIHDVSSPITSVIGHQVPTQIASSSSSAVGTLIAGQDVAYHYGTGVAGIVTGNNAIASRSGSGDVTSLYGYNGSALTASTSTSNTTNFFAANFNSTHGGGGTLANFRGMSSAALINTVASIPTTTIGVFGTATNNSTNNVLVSSNFTGGQISAANNGVAKFNIITGFASSVSNAAGAGAFTTGYGLNNSFTNSATTTDPITTITGYQSIISHNGNSGVGTMSGVSLSTQTAATAVGIPNNLYGLNLSTNLRTTTTGTSNNLMGILNNISSTGAVNAANINGFNQTTTVTGAGFATTGLMGIRNSITNSSTGTGTTPVFYGESATVSNTSTTNTITDLRSYVTTLTNSGKVTGTFGGVFTNLTNNSTQGNTIATSLGFSNNSTFSATSNDNVTNNYGVYSVNTFASSGLTSNGLIGAYFSNLNHSTNTGLLTTQSGITVYNAISRTNNVTNNFGANFTTDLTSTSSGAITNNFGVKIAVNKISGSSAVITNNYGLFIEDIQGGVTNNFSIYSNGGNVYLKDNVGIGTTTPTSKLQVVGLPVHVDNAAAVTAGLTAGAFYHSGDGIVRVVY